MKKLSFSILAISLAAISACQKDAGIAVTNLPQAMDFNVLSPGAQTKASDGGFASGDRAGIFITDYADDSTPMPLQISGNRANNLSIVCNGSFWAPAKTVYWGSSKSDVYAYYPYIDNVSDIDEQPWSIATDQTTEATAETLGAYEASDFLWAKAEGVSQGNGAVNLAMKHIMSKLTVKIVAGADYVGSLPDDATVLLHSTVTAARVDLEKGSAVKDPYSGSKTIKMRKLGIRTYEGVDAVVYEAIVVPQMLETSVPLIEINSKSVSYLLEDSFNFRPGVAYTYTATLNTSTTSIKVDIGCDLDDWNSTGDGGSGDGGESGGDDTGGDDDGITYTDLSAAGTANCYLVSAAGNYKFKSVLGNTDATVGNVKSVEVLWESFGTTTVPNVGDLIASVSYKDGYVRFSTPATFTQGNAVIAVRNSKGVILWSWHIWLSTEGWKDQVYYNDAGTMMDRNLGALSATPGDVLTNGLFYQWGRKDPFLGAASVSENIQAVSTGTWTVNDQDVHSINTLDENPLTFYSKKDCGDWGEMKTVYDPCPAGYRVPDGGEDGIWAKASGEAYFSFDTENWSPGKNFSGIFGADDTIWYPASGNLLDSMLQNVNSSGKCWGNFYCLSFDFDHYGFSIYYHINSADGLSVRCQKE